MASVSFKHVYKVYPGGVRAISDLNLDIDDKEFVVFVGPSGCGKSTTLRMIAGLEDISAGDLYIDGVRVNDEPPSKRDITMVFQNYALYPQKTVYENMAFGLRMAKVDRTDIDKRIKAAAKILGLEDYLSRKPRALSGGQRQRVALGRSIVREPKVFLLDEPLSNLDAKLRVQMRSEIAKLHRKLGVTFIYVTHDQTEAMTMGTNIVVMKDGVIQQVDSPSNLYDHPANVFVATFLGTPQMNILEGKLVEEKGELAFLFGDDDQCFALPLGKNAKPSLSDFAWIGKDVQLGVRPEDVKIDGEGPFSIKVDIVEKLGSELILHCYIKGTKIPLVLKADGRLPIAEGDELRANIDVRHLHLFAPGKEGKRIAGLLPKTYLEGSLDRETGKIISCGASLSLSEEERSCLAPECQGHDCPMALEIPFTAYHLVRGEGRELAFRAKIVSVEETEDGAIAFLAFEGKESYVGAKFKTSPGKAGESIDVYVRFADLAIVDPKHKEKLLARHAYTRNEIDAKVEKRGSKTYLKFASYSLLAPDSLVPGEYKLEIPYDAFVKASAPKRRKARKKLKERMKEGWDNLLAALSEKKREKALSESEKSELAAKKRAAKEAEKRAREESRKRESSRKKELRGKTFRIHPVNEEHIGAATILYANVPGFKDYLTIRGGKDDSCFGERHPSYALDYGKIVLKRKE